MEQATEILSLGHYNVDQVVDTVTLDYEARHKRRFVLDTDQGDKVLLDLPKAQLLQDGDGLRLQSGAGVIQVVAAAESLIEIRARDTHHMVRLAWHLGNRHLPAMIGPDSISIRADHVIEKMLLGLGADLKQVEAPFSPERGAYHDHGDGNGGHDHD